MLGWARISKKEDGTGGESLDLQEKRLLDLGCRKVFRAEGVSGEISLDSAYWAELVATLETNEQIACTHVSRISRKAHKLIGVVGVGAG